MGYDKSWWDKKRQEMGDEAFRKWNADRRKKYRHLLRADFLKEYGGKCVCCGESEPAFLCLDHKNGTGAEHRRQFYPGRGARGGSATQLLEDLRRRGWPKDEYQILCYNCNNAKAKLGKCPHECT